jgi:hypothetical protein
MVLFVILGGVMVGGFVTPWIGDMAKGDGLVFAVGTAEAEGVEPQVMTGIAVEPAEAFELAHGSADLGGLTIQQVGCLRDADRNAVALVVEVPQQKQQDSNIESLEIRAGQL